LPESSVVFEKYRSKLISLPLTALWRGYGSAIFLEFGDLSPRIGKDGFAGNPTGNFTVMIEWSWRIENETSIICGSWSDEGNWSSIFEKIIGQNVKDVSIHGRLPEISIRLTNGLYVVSFMTAEDQPSWAIIDNSVDREKPKNLAVRQGVIVEEFDI
tara:strand:+ start:63 stop:533 length:471 start_codon:yes stop_codon:yes gene_type:complete